MPIQLSLYDFFAYMIPGVFNILVVTFGLITFDIIDLDPEFWHDLSLFPFLVLLGAGYLIGLLLDKFTYKGFRLLKGRSRDVRKKTFESFRKTYPWIELHYTHEDWRLLRQSVKIKQPEVESYIEQQNAISIMLRNMSLGFLLTSLLFLLIFILLNPHIGNLILAAIALYLSFIALDRADERRAWFYRRVLNAFVTIYLLQENKLDDRIQTKPLKMEARPNSEEADFPQETKKPEESPRHPEAADA